MASSNKAVKWNKGTGQREPIETEKVRTETEKKASVRGVLDCSCTKSAKKVFPRF